MCGGRRAWGALSVEHANSELKQGLELSKKLQQGILKFVHMPCPYQVFSPCCDSVIHKNVLHFMPLLH